MSKKIISFVKNLEFIMRHPLLIRLGKFTFVGNLIVALLLPVIIIVPRWALLFGKLLQFVTGCDHIRAYPFLSVLLVSGLFFALAGLVFHLAVRKKQACSPAPSPQGEGNKNAGQRSFYAYYFITFLTSGALIVVFSTAFLNSFTQCIDEGRLFLFPLIYWGGVLLSLIQAALWMGAGNIWKINVGVGL
jgi:hypothetical protein